jgi:hypothetical protein
VGEIQRVGTVENAPIDAGNATDAGNTVDATNFPFPCCNANGDPCCPYLYCGAQMTPACAAQLDGGGPDHSVPEEAGPTDAPSDATYVDMYGYEVVSAFCCNANPDPCCRVLHCGELSDGTCQFPQEAGPNDAAADGDARD